MDNCAVDLNLGIGGGEVVEQPNTMSLPARVEVELGCEHFVEIL